MTIPEWAKPYHDAYMEAYGQTAERFHFTQMLKLRELDSEYGERCLEVWTRYLKVTTLQYFSVRHFLSTFDMWENPMVSKDAAIKRAWNAGIRFLDDKTIPIGGFQTERDFKKWLDIQLAKQDEP